MNPISISTQNRNWQVLMAYRLKLLHPMLVTRLDATHYDILWSPLLDRFPAFSSWIVILWGLPHCFYWSSAENQICLNLEERQLWFRFEQQGYMTRTHYSHQQGQWLTCEALDDHNMHWITVHLRSSTIDKQAANRMAPPGSTMHCWGQVLNFGREPARAKGYALKSSLAR